MVLRLAVLGPVRAARDTGPVPLGPARGQAVFVALALRAGRVAGREQLLDAVWGEHPPASGGKVLPSYVYALRRRLDPPGTRPEDSLIRAEHGGYRIDERQLLLDSDELEAAGREAGLLDPDAALHRLDRALALVRGEPLAGLPGPFAAAERARLRQRVRGLRVQRLQLLAELGRFAAVLEEPTAFFDPCDEQVAALRIRALHGSGRQAEALQAYEEIRRLLRHELGVDPGPGLRRAHQAVLRQEPGVREPVARQRPGRTPDQGPGQGSDHAHSRPRTPHPAGPLNTLPGDSGRLIGRDTELALLTAPSAPGAVGVLTVHGPAGVGKSALVVRAARELSARYPDGCLFVDLRGHSTQRRRTPEQALQRLLRTLGAAKGELPGDLDELTEAWRAATSGLRLLLVLDDALDAEQVRPLLPAGADSRVLVAGRRRLADLDAERRLALDPLDSAQAVSLLTHLIGDERAAAEREAAARLARLCDGLPLALRIAGSRLQNRAAWSVQYLVGRMAGDGRLLGELSVGDRSVEAAFRLSYDQLDAEQQRGFRALGLTPTVEFDVRTAAAMLSPGPYAAYDAEGCRDTEELLEGLVDASLLQEPRPGRYRLHDLVRVHARRTARTVPEEATAVCTKGLHLHLAAARLASDWGTAGFPSGPDEPGGEQALGGDRVFGDWRAAEAWLDSFGGDLPDVVGHAVLFEEYDLACWIAEAYTDYFVRQGRYHEAQTALELALAHTDRCTDPRMPLAVRSCLAYTAIHQRRYTQARALCTEVLEAARQCGARGEEARALTGLGATALSVGEGSRALAYVTEAAQLCAARQDSWLGAMALLIQGLSHQFEGCDEAALASFAAARACAEGAVRTGERSVAAKRHPVQTGQHPAATDEPPITAGPPSPATTPRPHMLGRILSCSADIHLRSGRYGEAARLLTEAVRLVEQGGDVFQGARSLTRLGTAVHGQGDPGAAIGLHQQALVQLQLLSPLTEPGYAWLEMDIRSRLGGALMATGRLTEALRQYEGVVRAPDRGRGPGTAEPPGGRPPGPEPASGGAPRAGRPAARGPRTSGPPRGTATGR
ncbi:DNA-binding transcriptional activator of the SARP family [Streptomyces indicus]|uniref:DNA-binding transcriptional activator of the SARP family n=1 Tax=Streptomyces indicus TaxID=417292 RepID=A0A1G9HMF6_9ACTN|nr:DNA-binding transcriptional activator of the SARP family [Streptomyces indicus]